MIYTLISMGGRSIIYYWPDIILLEIILYLGGQTGLFHVRLNLKAVSQE